MWECIVGRVVPDVSEGSGVVIFYGQAAQEVAWRWRWQHYDLLKSLWATHAKTYCHIAEDLSPKLSVAKLVNKFSVLYGTQSRANGRMGRLSEKSFETWTSSHNLKRDPIRGKRRSYQKSPSESRHVLDTAVKLSLCRNDFCKTKCLAINPSLLSNEQIKCSLYWVSGLEVYKITGLCFST